MIMNSLFSLTFPWAADPTINTIAMVIGAISVVLVVSSYAMKNRLTIVITGLIARALAIVQYAMMGKIEGMVLNAVGVLCFELARRRETLSKPWRIAAYVFSNAIAVAVSVATYVSPISLLPLFGLLFHVNGAWRKRAMSVRLVTLPGCPLWFAYNFISGTYASCVGDALSFAIIVASLIKYDVLDKRKKQA